MPSRLPTLTAFSTFAGTVQSLGAGTWSALSHDAPTVSFGIDSFSTVTSENLICPGHIEANETQVRAYR